MVKKLNITPYCEECHIELVETESGLLCPACGGFMSDKELMEYD